MTEGRKVKVSLRALIARLNRALASDGRILRKVRGANPYLASWYVVDTTKNVVLFSDVTLEQLAREGGMLRDWEEVDRGS